MSTVVEKHEPSYAYANLSFSRISNADLMGEVNAWKTAEMEVVCIGGSSGEGAHVGYDVEATDPTKKPGDAGWYIGRVSMHAVVGGAIALDDELMRRVVDEVKAVLRNRVAQGQPIVEVERGALVFNTCVMVDTV